MIEVFGLGARGQNGHWLFRRASGTVRRGEVAAVVGEEAAARQVFLDALSGRSVAEEGRVWIEGVAVTRQRRAVVRALVANVSVDDGSGERRSVLAAVQSPRSRLERLVSLVGIRRRDPRRAVELLTRVGLGGRPRDPVAALDGVDLARLRLAQALVTRPRYVVVRGIDRLSRRDARDLVGTLRAIARAERVTFVVELDPASSALDLVDQRLVARDGATVAAPTVRTG